ncbi:signal peptidase I [Terricaulis silvestris]|uniref:Signal peptidase I n=1 Tax=Terricaulis silvestris TaxID=2686094 RepID=A0A6I6MWD1_9CAUL|nr:signal peptidase I [Terricaulis silvestris]QGZ97077.1 Signal peptidase I [Terricaulis silvestris]
MTNAETGRRRRKGWFTPTVITLGLIAALFISPFGLGFRLYRAPSGSMQPTVYPGDYFVITKWSYGYSRYSAAPLSLMFPAGRVFARQPERGDLVVFRPAPEPDRDFIKRVVGVPGDRIQMIDGVLHINGVAVERESLGDVSFGDEYGGTVEAQLYRETLPGGASYRTLERGDGELDNTRVFVVPANRYFVMGDDRDNSADSRVPSVVGYVPFDNFVGRVAWTIPSSPSERLPE